jgi:hypothetical protein
MENMPRVIQWYGVGRDTLMKDVKMCMVIHGAADHLKISCVQWKRRFNRTDNSPFCQFPCVLLVEFLPQGSTINAGVYCDKLKKLCRAIQNKRRGILSLSIVRLHDNAHPYTATTTQDLITTSPYSPDLAPSDFHMFLHLKTFLGGWWFHDDEVKEVVNMWSAS